MPGQILRHLGAISVILRSEAGVLDPDASTAALQVMKDVAGEVDKIILKFIQGHCPAMLYRPVVYLPKLRRGRPKQRSALGWLIYAALSGNYDLSRVPPSLQRVLAFMELSAMATYVLDDIIDSQERRERRPATHVKFGVNMGWIAGSLQSFLALRMLDLEEYPLESAVEDLMEDDTPNIPKLQLQSLATRMWHLMWEGEGMNECMTSANQVDYVDRCYKVAAVMYEAVSQMAAIIAGANEEQVTLAREIGRAFGLSVMVSNDLMCFLSRSELQEHSVAQDRMPYEDIRKGVWTHPITHTWQHANPSQREQILDVMGYQNASDEECANLARLVKELGGIEAGLALNSKFRNQFMWKVARLPVNDARAMLISLGWNLEHVRQYFA